MWDHMQVGDDVRIDFMMRCVCRGVEVQWGVFVEVQWGVFVEVQCAVFVEVQCAVYVTVGVYVTVEVV